MSNFRTTDGIGDTKYLKASGDGTDVDPYVIEQDVSLIGVNGEKVTVQNPIPINGNTITSPDVDVSGSDIGTFSGTITDLFDSLDSTITSTGHSIPANFTIKLNRTVTNSGVKFCSPIGKNFSNTKITIFDRAGNVLREVDESADSTKYSSREFDWEKITFCSIKVEFYTTDDIDINWADLDVWSSSTTVISGIDPAGSVYNEAVVTPEGALLSEVNAHTLPETSVHMIATNAKTDTFAVASSKGDNVITVNNGAQWSANDKIKILDGPNTEYDILKVVSVSVNDLTLDRQLDAPHPIGEDIVGLDVNMAVNGSVTPVSFKYEPRDDQVVYIHTIHVTMSSSGEPSLEKFGGITALSKGVHFRVKNVTGRDYTYWVPFRSNNSFNLSGFNYIKESKVGVNWFMHMELDMAKSSLSAIELDGREGQYFEMIVQDDLSTLVSFEIKLGIHDEPL